MSFWVTGVSIITGMTGDGSHNPIGIVCNSLASISLEKRLILWSVDKSSTSYADWIMAKSFIVHFLSADQQSLVKKFATKGTNKFKDIPYKLSIDGNPMLDGASVRMECATTEIFDTFDHALIVGTVTSLENFKRAPLIFVQRSLRGIELDTK